MNHIVTSTDLKDTICSNCHCKDQHFLHHVCVKGRDQKFCTSCVLFTHKLSFCPTCFHLHDFPLEDDLIRCRKCSSYSHAFCYSADGNPLGVPACSTCINPERLIFELKEYKVQGTDEWRKGIDMEAARLLLTAAEIVNKSTFKVHDEAAYSNRVRGSETVMEKKRARTAVERCIKLKDGKVTGSLHMLSIEGAASEPRSGRVVKKVHNEKYRSKNAFI